MKKIKRRFRRREIVVLAAAILVTLSFFSVADARSVLIQTNKVDLIPNTKAEGGTARFTDSVDSAFSLDRTLANGAISPGDAFTIHDLYQAVSFTLSLSAPDNNIPGYTTEKVTRNRTNSLPASYPNIPGVVFFPVDTWLPTISDTPPPVTGVATQTGFNLEMMPIIKVDLALTTADPYTGYYASNYYPFTGYHYVVTDVTGGGSTVVDEGDVGGGSFSLPPTKFPPEERNYILRAYAYNSYTTGKGTGATYDPKWSGDIIFNTVKGVGGPASMVLTLESNVPNGPGINFISLGMPADKTTGNWYAPNNTTNKTIKTAYDLVLAVNEAAGIANPATDAGVVSTFGRWDKTAAVQKDAGVLIDGKIANNAEAALKAIPLKQEEGYQLYVGPLTNNKLEILIKNSAQ